MHYTDAVAISSSLLTDIFKVSPCFTRNHQDPHPYESLDKVVIYSGFVLGDEKGKVDKTYCISRRIYIINNNCNFNP